MDAKKAHKENLMIAFNHHGLRVICQRSTTRRNKRMPGTMLPAMDLPRPGATRASTSAGMYLRLGRTSLATFFALLLYRPKGQASPFEICMGPHPIYLVGKCKFFGVVPGARLPGYVPT